MAIQSHPGAWFGLPDYGVTEKIGGLFGAKPTAAGGSNLLPNSWGTTSTVPAQPTPAVRQTTSVVRPAPVGQVQGVSTNSLSGLTNKVNQVTQPQQPQQPQQDPISGGIQNAFGDIQNRINEMIGFLPGEQQQLEARIGDIANQQISGIQQAGQNQLDKFGGYREQVGQQQAASLKDLSTNVRNMFQAGNSFLGNFGASNSSANPMMQTAITKDANKNRTAIRNQAMSMMTELDTKEADVRSSIESTINEVNTWKSSQLSEIGQYFQTRLNELRNQGLDMSMQEKQALLGRLQEIEQNAQAYSQQIAQVGMSRLQQLNDYKLQLSKSAAWDPQEIATQEMSFLPQMQQTGSDMSQGIFGLPRTEEERKSIYGI